MSQFHEPDRDRLGYPWDELGCPRGQTRSQDQEEGPRTQGKACQGKFKYFQPFDTLLSIIQTLQEIGGEFSPIKMINLNMK